MMIILVLVVGAHIICAEIEQWPVRKWKHSKNDKIVLFLGSKNLEVHIYLLHIVSHAIQTPKAIIS